VYWERLQQIYAAFTENNCSLKDVN